MGIFARTILGRVVDTGMTAALARLPAAYRPAGRFMGPVAAMGILRLAFRFPALAWILILSVIAARVLGGRRPESSARLLRNRPCRLVASEYRRARPRPWRGPRPLPGGQHHRFHSIASHIGDLRTYLYEGLVLNSPMPPESTLEIGASPVVVLRL
jgi:hypothetical protein